jgi:hypothetical protein
VQERDSGRAPARSGGLKIFQPPQHLDAPVTERSAEHPMTGKKNSLQIVRDKRVSGRVLQQAWRLGLIASALGAHSDLPVNAIRLVAASAGMTMGAR